MSGEHEKAVNSKKFELSVVSTLDKAGCKKTEQALERTKEALSNYVHARKNYEKKYTSFAARQNSIAHISLKAENLALEIEKLLKQRATPDKPLFVKAHPELDDLLKGLRRFKYYFHNDEMISDALIMHSQEFSDHTSKGAEDVEFSKFVTGLLKIWQSSGLSVGYSTSSYDDTRSGPLIRYLSSVTAEAHRICGEKLHSDEALRKHIQKHRKQTRGK